MGEGREEIARKITSKTRASHPYRITLSAMRFAIIFRSEKLLNAPARLDLYIGLENRRWATILEFESLRFRHKLSYRARPRRALSFLGLTGPPSGPPL